jgi:DNA-binding transcriptional MocR family regulator
MFKGEDVVLLLKLSASGPEWTVRTLAEETGISRSVVHRALKRLAAAGLLDERRRRVNGSQAEEFLIHAVKYIFPAVLAGESRGFPTAWAAEPLVDHIASSPSELAPVWPDPKGRRRGLALRPLHEAVPEAARRDPALGEGLALVDALRLGDARIRGVAAELLVERLAEPAPA